MASRRCFCDRLPSKQAVAGSSPVSRSLASAVSLQAVYTPVEDNRAAIALQGDIVILGENTCSDNLPHVLRQPALSGM